MDFNFTNNADFLDFLKKKQIQIIDKTTDVIQESEGFKILFAGLKSMLNENAFNGSRALLISEEDIVKVRLREIETYNELFKSEDFTHNQKITLDEKLNAVKSERCRLPEDSNEARNFYAELSKSGCVVFLLLKDKINYFINGSDKSESIFFSLEDINRHNEKKDISKISDVFTEYQEVLKERKYYSKFFVHVSHLKSLKVDLGSSDSDKIFIKNNKHILRNRPEDTFRDDLRKYLHLNLKVSQIKEFLLESLKRLDIYLYDEFGEIYLIEVKWVGESIHQDGKKLGTSFNESDINPEAFKQALNYLEELDNKGQNILKAYLVVFDARRDDFEDTGYNFDDSILTEIQSKHYRKFKKMKDLRVKNYHPS